ncbi:NAD(P)-binding domain-containing protein [Actinoplanes sp. NPDC049265]|uniref:NAD(P)-binding domain-containing protein n=1 Tax=Actinoplanes sp. NPDC049265 TaxID=3363902 RepID=UPI003715524B
MSGGRPRVGVIGLGPMGVGLATNFVRHGYHVVAYNRTGERALKLAADGELTGHVTAALSYRDFAAALGRPRRAVLLVDPEATADVLCEVARWLEPGDIVLEGGNAAHTDSIRRQDGLRAAGLRMLDVGIASGADGALDGISATVGGDAGAFAEVAADLAAVGTDVNGRTCCVHVGGDGTGHFVKMVHNGVEYTIMQLVAEVVQVLRVAAGVEPQRLGEALDGWDTDEFGSYLLRVAVDVLRHVDAATGLPFIDVVGDRAVQNGSGSRAGQSALALGTPATLFAASSFARAVAHDTELRSARRVRSPGAVPSRPDLVREARAALRAALLVTYGQAFRHVHAADREFGWRTDLAEVAHSWCGATIRSSWLRRIAESMSGEEMPSLLRHPLVDGQLRAAEPALRRLVGVSADIAVPSPCLSSALVHLDEINIRRSSGAIVQALRSRLGGSSYERTDRAGDFRLDWSSTKAERQV